MSHDVVLIPCEICNKSVAFEDYQTHQAQHAAEATSAAYDRGNMYGQGPIAPVDPLAGGIGPMPRPKGWQDPHPNSQITMEDYIVENVEGTNIPNPVQYDYNQGSMYGKSGDKNTDSKEENKDDEKMHEIQDLSEKSADLLRDNGCCIIKNGVRKDLISNALRIINNALRSGPHILSTEEYTKNNNILDLFNESAAFSLAQNVLGLTNVIIPKSAEIKLVFPEKEEMDQKDMESLELNWKVEGLGEGELAPFTLGMRMILSKQKFKYFKGSHQMVFNMIKEIGMESFIELNKDAKDRKEFEDKEKNELENIEVNKGDIIIYHPFLCQLLEDKNDTENIEYFVDFRVNHKNFNESVGKKRAEHLWLGYEQLNDTLNGEELKI